MGANFSTVLNPLRLSVGMRLEMENTKYPACCGETMKLHSDAGKFLELMCRVCGDTVYLKKGMAQKPRMIDD